MMMCYPAKCILAGEYVALRGFKALVAPFQGYHLKLIYKKSAAFCIRTGRKIWPQRLIDGLQKYLPSNFYGELTVESTIPPASGLGSSAAFCVALANILAQQNYIPLEKIFQTAKLFENLFHGQSSGVDIAGVMASGLISYHQQEGPQPIIPSWKPLLYISDSGQNSETSQAMKKKNDYSLPICL